MTFVHVWIVLWGAMTALSGPIVFVSVVSAGNRARAQKYGEKRYRETFTPWIYWRCVHLDKVDRRGLLAVSVVSFGVAAVALSDFLTR